MIDNIRTLTATALLILGFTKASAKIERSTLHTADHPEATSGYCLPCNCTE